MTDSILAQVPPSEVPNVWKEIFHHLEPAVDRCGGLYTMRDLFTLVMQGQMHLWTSTHECKIEAVAVTRFIDYPQLRVFAYSFIGGKHSMVHWFQFQDQMEDWAVRHGASMAEGYARKGWLRVLSDDWKQRWITIHKRLI